LWVLSEPGSRPSEMASPKRDIAIMCEALFAFVAQASWRWVFGQEMISHRRDNMVWSLF